MSRDTRERWYAIPPYVTTGKPQSRGWQVHTDCGELVAEFERRDDCEAAVSAYNDRQHNGAKTP